MWFDIDWGTYIIQNLPYRRRKVRIIQYLKALIQPLVSIYDEWYDWRLDNLYKLEHSGQVCYLRGSLNDRFDPIERRIRLGNGQQYATQYIFTEAEEQDVWLSTESESDTIWLRTEAETADTGLDFIVYVPHEIYSLRLEGLVAHIDFYRAGGKRYKIIIDE